MVERAIDIAQHEGAAIESVERFRISCEKKPAARLRVIARGIFREHRRRVAPGIDGKRDEAYVGELRNGTLQAPHLCAHTRARTGAVGEYEVGHPDFTVERLAVERLAGLRSEMEGRYL